MIERYKGYPIERNEDGYFVDHHGVVLGYCDTLPDIRDAIDQDIIADYLADPEWPPLDSPSLPDPWWSAR